MTILPILLFFGIVIGNTTVVYMIKYSKNPLKPIILNPQSEVMQKIQEFYPWAKENGFEWVNSYKTFGSAVVAAWEKKGEPTFLCVYCLSNGTISRDFTTDFNDGGGLTTANSPDACMFPLSQGNYNQTFPNSTIEEQWNWHQHAIEHLKKNLNVDLSTDNPGFEKAFIKGVKGPVEYITSLPLWQFRAPYWFLVRRKRMSGKTVSELLNAGLLK
jgi:hypothetical protein